ncbi:MAG: DNA repair protein RecO [Oculatellaceae cyanobacterium Prado106]|nr:DNA repair protein RecO [Oculatellaceae cyanobacterium Prado106]
MSGTYKAIGINLKTTPFGESDRLLTILTEDLGLIRAVAPGSRKHKSSLGGRSGLFVVNQLLIAKGRSLDKVIQAESLESYPGLSLDLSKLTASQYLAELALNQALSDQPQTELFHLLREHLSRLETLPVEATLPCLTHATFHLLVLAGVAPQVQSCCITQTSVTPNFDDPDWQIGFSVVSGGIVHPSALEHPTPARPILKTAERSSTRYRVSPSPRTSSPASKNSDPLTHLSAMELALLQQLSTPNFIQDLLETDRRLLHNHHRPLWLSLERALRRYAEYHLDQPIRSATLIDTCFAPLPAPSLAREL